MSLRLLTSGVLLAAILAVPNMAGAAESNVFNANNTGTQIETQTGLGNTNVSNATATVVNMIIGLLGIIALILIFYGAFTWMTAGGNEDNISKAKNIIVAAAVGLLIVFLSAAIARYLLEQTGNVTGVNVNALPSGSSSSSSSSSSR